MPLVDQRGRLFGRLNLIDALVLIVVGGVIPLIYGAFLLFRTPVPTVDVITPHQLEENRRTPAQIAGTNLRPFMLAFVGTAVSPRFLIESPTAAQIEIPPLPAGTYDFVLADEGQEVLRKVGAITVAPMPRTIATVHVRFIAAPEALSQLTPGETDRSAPSGAATLTSIDNERTPVQANVEYWIPRGATGLPEKSLQVPERLLAFTGTLTVPVVDTPAGWIYKDGAVKVGARFTFESKTGIAVGSIVRVEGPQGQ